MLLSAIPGVSLPSIFTLAVVGLISSFFYKILYRIYWHPLAKYPGPWYAAATSLTAAVYSAKKIEPQWLQSLVDKYGCMCIPEAPEEELNSIIS